MRMLGTTVHLELPEHLATELVLRQHALDRLLDQVLGTLDQELLGIDGTNPAGITAMTLVHLVGHLVPGQFDLVGIQNDDEIAGIDARGVDSFVLAAEDPGNFGGGATQDLVFQNYDVPIPLDIRLLSDLRAHRVSSLGDYL